MGFVFHAIGSLFDGGGGQQQQQPQIINLPPVPQYTDPSIAAAAAAQATAAAAARGRASTIATSGQGDTSIATTAKKSLLGA